MLPVFFSIRSVCIFITPTEVSYVHYCLVKASDLVAVQFMSCHVMGYATCEVRARREKVTNHKVVHFLRQFYICFLCFLMF